MNCFDAFRVCFQKYAVFSGRARRSEFWGFYLANILAEIALGVLGTLFIYAGDEGVLAAFLLPGLYSLVIFLPSLAVAIRRLHDTDHSGAYILMNLIPVAGPIIVLVAYCTESSLGENRYGPNPKTGFGNAWSPPVSPAVSPGTEPKTPNPKIPFTRDPQSFETRTLVCVEGSMKGQRFPLTPGKTIVIGRDPRVCNIVLPMDTPGVSKTHCKITFDGSDTVITDMSSTYGTYIHGEKLQPGTPTRLHRGLAVDLGGRETRFTLS